MISIATEADIPALLEFARAMHAFGTYRLFSFSDEKITTVLTTIITGDPTKAIMLVDKESSEIVAAMGAIVAEAPCSHDLLATECLWWIAPKQPPRKLYQLLSAYEYWAKHIAKCKAALVSRIKFSKQTKHFAAQGYRLGEETYIKELQ